MSSTGYMQHSNHECMKEEEYDEFIADPYAFAIDKCLPRLYKNLNISTNPGRVLFTLVQEAFMEQLYYKKK